MMAKGHIVSSASAWLIGCAAVDLAHPLHAGPVVAGAVIASGFALVPDIDHPGSTVSRTLGPLTRSIAGLVESGSSAVRRRSCRCCTTDTSGGHRTLTHTAAGAVATGLLVTGLVLWLGPVVTAVMVGFSAWLAAHTALPARVRAELGDVLLPGKFRRLGRGAHRFAAAIGALMLGGMFAVAALAGLDGLGGWWIGLAVGFGLLAHIGGDAMTHWGVPLCWPLPIRGCRWRCVGTPRWMRFRAGSRIERWLVTPLFAVAALGSVWLLAT